VTAFEADVVFEHMCDAVRAGRFDQAPTNVASFDAFADLYHDRYVKLRGLRSADEIEQRLAALEKRWQGKELACGSTVSKPPSHGSTMDSLSRFFQVRPLRPIL